MVGFVNALAILIFLAQMPYFLGGGTAVYARVALGPTVGDLGELPTALPWVALPQVPLTPETLQIVAPYVVALAFIGLLESLLTAQILDDMTDTGYR